MNYLPVAAGTIINKPAGTQGELNAGTSEEISQDCIVMLIWKDASYFDSPSKDVDNGEPKSATDDQKQVKDGPDNENGKKDKYEDDSSPKEVNTARQHNPHAKIFYIRKQKEPGKPKEEIYSNSKIIQVIKTYWELGHEHKFITKIFARRANECIVSITDPDYKNLNKNDIDDMYLLIMNGKVPDYAKIGLLWSLSVFIRSSVIWERVHDFQLGIESYQQKVNPTAPTISFLGVEKHKIFSIIYEPMHGIIYKNSKKEKRMMRHLEIHKFCDATLIRVLEGLKSHNNNVKYDYVQRELTNDEVEYLKLFEEEIEVRLKYRNQMRKWEMYVNGRPLGPRRERPE
ncbi:hypothetical protein Tco_0488841 [Tanacetum coccineum]